MRQEIGLPDQTSAGEGLTKMEALDIRASARPSPAMLASSVIATGVRVPASQGRSFGLPRGGLKLAPGCVRGATRDNRAHDEELIQAPLSKRFASNEWQPQTGLR